MQAGRALEAWRRSCGRSFTHTVVPALLQRSAHTFSPAEVSTSQCAGAKSLPASAGVEGSEALDLSTRSRQQWWLGSTVLGYGSGCGSGSESESQVCGRGDKRTKKGKRFKGTFGNSRHRKSWETKRLREKWEIPSGPVEGSLLPRPFPPLMTRY